jgi:hypothetical protein
VRHRWFVGLSRAVSRRDAGGGLVNPRSRQTTGTAVTAISIIPRNSKATSFKAARGSGQVAWALRITPWLKWLSIFPSDSRRQSATCARTLSRHTHGSATALPRREPKSAVSSLVSMTKQYKPGRH